MGPLEPRWLRAAACALVVASGCRRDKTVAAADPTPHVQSTKHVAECREGSVLANGKVVGVHDAGPSPSPGWFPRFVATATAASGAHAEALAWTSCLASTALRSCGRDIYMRLYAASDGGVGFHGTLDLDVVLDGGKVANARRIAGDTLDATLERCVIDALAAAPSAGAATATGSLSVTWIARKWVTKVSTNFVEIPDGIDAALVEAATEASFPKLASCYEDGRTRNPTIGGPLFPRFVVDADGKAQKIELGDGTKSDAATQKCMIDVIAKITFPKPKSGAAQIVYPIELHWELE